VTETLLAFALTSFILEITPGPNMAWLALLGIERGRRQPTHNHVPACGDGSG
jgi:threonine/homoserine/homoserine lactone efflux protein